MPINASLSAPRQCRAMSDTDDKTPPARSQDRLMATVSHELRTPLNGIIGTASLLAETGLDANQQSYVRTIRQSAGQLLDMLNNVLDFARLSEGRFELDRREVSVADLAQDVCELLATRAHEKGLDLAICLRPGTPATIETDGTRLRQILFNLVGNAIKFTDSGGVLIDIESDGESLLIAVRDTGPGIPKAARERLFEAFGQARAEDARKDSGVGLGLAIVKTLSEALGGVISVESAPGAGSCFRLCLPAGPGPAAVPPMPDTAGRWREVNLTGFTPATLLGLSAALISAGFRVSHRRPETSVPTGIVTLADIRLPAHQLDAIFAAGPAVIVLRPEDRALIPDLRARGCAAYLVRPVRSESLIDRLRLLGRGSDIGPGDDRLEEPDGKGRHVLVAEDNAVNALIARRALEKAGFRVTLASTGQEAVELAEERDFDLVLMDLRMPVMNGFDALQRIGAIRPALPMIAVSAEIDPDIERRARGCGAVGVAAKPLDTGTLLRLCARWTAERESAA